MGHSGAPFLFNTVDSKLNFDDDWFRTAELWCQKRPLYQMSPELLPDSIKNVITKPNDNSHL